MTNETPITRAERLNPALLASAMLILAMLIVQAARLAPANEARADVSTVGGLSILTASSGDGEDILCILDTRAERLLVYGVVNRNQVDLHQAVDVSIVFSEARAAAAGPAGRPRR